jgi:orotate phosphoribosyltransferase
MTPASTYLDKKTIAELTARMYLDTGAVRFMTDKPFIFTSGWASPVYNDSRWLISFPHVRSTLMDFMIATIARDIGRDKLDAVAGGETAGIPFAAWVADRLGLPMQYVRKKPKGFGRNAQIEGHVADGQRVLLVEDMTSDGGSKVTFVDALRKAGTIVVHCFVIFFYDIVPESAKILGDLSVTLLKGDLAGIVKARRLSQATMRNIRQNLFFAFIYNAAGVPIAAGVLYPVFGILLSPIVGAVAMALSSVSVITNALRLRATEL